MIMANKEELTAQAEELGIEVQESWTKAQIEEAIDAILAGDDSGDEQGEQLEGDDVVIKNISRFRHKVFGKIVQPGKTYTLTDADMDNEKGCKRIENAIRKGYLERV